MVTIVIPVYNKEKYLERCVNSVLNQSYKDIEIILVDDGSTDGSSTLCDYISKKNSISTTIHQKNQGPYAARTKGAQNAKGEWIMFVDADDLLLPNALQLLSQYMDTDCDLISGNLVFKGNSFKQKINHKVDKLDYIKAMFTGETNIGPYCKLFRTSILKTSLGGGNLPRTIRQNEDLYMNVLYATYMKSYLYMDRDIICYEYNDIPNALSKSGLMPLNNWILLFDCIQSILVKLNSSSINRAFIAYQFRILKTIVIYGDEMTFSLDNNYVKKLIASTSSLNLSQDEKHAIYLIQHKWMQKLYHFKTKMKKSIKKILKK